MYLNLIPPTTTVVQYTNSLDLRLNQIQADWHSENISQILGEIKALWKLKHTKSLADDNLLATKG